MIRSDCESQKCVEADDISIVGTVELSDRLDDSLSPAGVLEQRWALLALACERPFSRVR